MFHKADPSNNYKYLIWMLERFLKAPKEIEGAIDQPKRLIVEDLDKTAGFLDFFNKFNDRFEENKRNINNYMSTDEFYDVVDAKMPKDGDFMSASQMERQFKKEIEVWLDNDNWKVVVPLTYGASCAYGKHSRWCTASTTSASQFDSHNNKGPLIILINKNAVEGDDRFHKYQFHFETNQFMDAHDKSVKDTYFDMLVEDKDLLNAFLKHLKSSVSFKIRIKLGMNIPDNKKRIEDVNNSNFTFDLRDMRADALPEGLEIVGNIDISGNKHIKDFSNIKVHGNVNLSNSTVETIGGIEVGKSFKANDCKELRTIGDGFRTLDGAALFKSCTKLEALPNNSDIQGNLYASGSIKVDSLPDNLKVKNNTYVRNTEYETLLKSGKASLPGNGNFGKGDHSIYYGED